MVNPQKLNRKPVATVTVFECTFCKTPHYINASSDNLREAHSEIEAILNKGCHKCYGRIVFKEHKHL